VSVDPADATLPPVSPFLDANYRSWLPDDLDTPILDFGCGDGTHLEWMRKLGYTNLVGFDINPAAGGATTVEVETGRDGIAWLGVRSGTFGVVLTANTLSYFPRPAHDIVGAIRDALTPGGRVIATTMNAATVAGVYPFWNDPHFLAAYAEHGWRMLFEQSGLEVIHVGGEQPVGSGIKFRMWQLAQQLAALRSRASYLIVRGADARNPSIFDKMLLLVAEKAVPDDLQSSQ
jgi:SAM-dependent methyltransferase